MQINFIFFFLSLLSVVNGNNEQNLRKKLFSNYDKNLRPVLNTNQSVNMKIGIEIRNIE